MAIKGRDMVNARNIAKKDAVLALVASFGKIQATNIGLLIITPICLGWG